QENRNFPVDFPYPFEEEWQIIIHHPPNTKLIELPLSGHWSLPGEQGSCSIEYSAEAHQIVLNSHLIIKQDLYPPEDYPALKELFDHYVQQLYNRIVIQLR